MSLCFAYENNLIFQKKKSSDFIYAIRWYMHVLWCIGNRLNLDLVASESHSSSLGFCALLEIWCDDTARLHRLYVVRAWRPLHTMHSTQCIVPTQTHTLSQSHRNPSNNIVRREMHSFACFGPLCWHALDHFWRGRRVVICNHAIETLANAS